MFWILLHFINIIAFVVIINDGSNEIFAYALWGGVLLNVVALFCNLLILGCWYWFKDSIHLNRVALFFSWFLIVFITNNIGSWLVLHATFFDLFFNPDTLGEKLRFIKAANIPMFGSYILTSILVGLPYKNYNKTGNS